MDDGRIRRKKIRQVLIVMWGMLFCMNLILCLIMSDPKPLNWIMVGIPFGAVMILLINYALESSLDKLLFLQGRMIDKLIKEIPIKKKK